MLGLLLAACSPKYIKYANSYENPSLSPEPDYANLYYWAAHPSKRDPADSIPAALNDDYHPDSRADVFFLHPTTFTDKDDTGRNASLLDAALNAKTDYSSILYQASAFNEFRVFAPRYRQAHIRTYFATDTAAAMATFDKAYQDIRHAFQHYLATENKGRPIVIASHSQGSTHAIRLLKEFFDGQPLKHQLVAAYIVGMYIPANAFTAIPLCADSTQTGCFCAWRTYRQNYTPEFVNKEKNPSPVTNPINWTTKSDKADASLNQGAILRNFNKMYYKVADARIESGILWTKKPRFPGGFLLRTKNYHIGDINLYYNNIRQNLRQRINHFTQTH